MNNKLITAFALSLLIPLSSIAGEKEDELIAKVTEAYGGEALLNLKNYTIKERYIAPTTGQGHTARLIEIGHQAQVLTVDLENNNSVYDTWFEGRTGGFQNGVISDGEKAHTINYQAETYGDAANADPHVFAGGSMRTSDTVLAYELNKVKEEATVSDDEAYMNRNHHVITMPFPSSPDLKLYVDAQTHLISKMIRVNPQLGDLDYVYTNHQKDKGIGYAANIDFYIAGVPNLIGSQHDLRFNQDLADNTFSLPEGFSPEAERIDASEMLVNKLSDRVYHVGQNGGFSIFADTSMGIIGAGGYPGIPARLDRFQTESGSYKPLTYQVVTHHHSDHIGGMGEAVALGAKLVTVEENVQEIKDATSPEPGDSSFYAMGPRASFGDGRNRVDVYEVSTLHAASFLVTYIPAVKTVFIADHMGSPYAKGVPVANLGTVDMLAALDALDIDIDKIATAHNARIFTIKDMRDSVAAFQPSACAGGRPVCK